MKKNNTKTASPSIERKILMILLSFFTVVMLSAWVYSMNIRKTIMAKNSVENVDVRALVELERIRNVSDSQIANGLTFFLLGSTNIFDEQKKNKQEFGDALASFEKQYSLPQISEIIKRIETLRTQQQEFFDQGMDFRAKQTESKIVGQFYRAKAYPIRANINKALDEIVVLHNAEFARVRDSAQEAAGDIETQIPKGMAWLTALTSMLFFAISLLVLRMVKQRSHHLAERGRLFEAAKEAVHARDGVLAAVAQDFVEPLTTVSQTVNALKSVPAASPFRDNIEVIETSALMIEDRIRDIQDQTRADMGTMNLRLDQTGLDDILDDARMMLQPLAKKRDVRLEFNPVNPPVLAFLDRERVMRVLANLVGNAIKFSPPHSKVVVKVRSDQQFVYVSVKDSGPGIPEKHLADLFGNFWQARKTADQGPGIGLAIVKTIIEAQGGIVTVESHVGHGSTFTFSLPRRRPVGANINKPSTPAAVRFAARPPKPSEFEESSKTQ